MCSASRFTSKVSRRWPLEKLNGGFVGAQEIRAQAAECSGASSSVPLGIRVKQTQAVNSSSKSRGDKAVSRCRPSERDQHQRARIHRKQKYLPSGHVPITGCKRCAQARRGTAASAHHQREAMRGSYAGQKRAASRGVFTGAIKTPRCCIDGNW